MTAARSAVLAVLLGALTTAGPDPARAQEHADPFSWVRLGVGISDLSPGMPDGDYWRPRPGPLLRMETPLRPGLVSLGFERHSADAGVDVTDPDVARLAWTMVWLGWGAEVGPARLRVGGEGRIGTLVSSAAVGVSNPVERELLTGAAAWLRSPLFAGLSLRAEAAAARVHARHPWNPVSLGVAIAKELPLPLGARRALAEPPAAGGERAQGEEDVAPPWRSFAELPSLALGVDGVGTDGVDQSWSPGALRAPESGAPAVWLDGFRVRDATLGGAAWPWLPLGPGDVRRASGLARADLAGGRPELEGALDVVTGPPRDGRSMRARGLIVNESRDPGPLRFTALTSPNVDGPLYEADGAAAHAWSGGWLTASVVRRERWSLTRPELRARNPAFWRGASSRVRTDGASAGVQQLLGRVTLRGRAWASEGDRYVRAPGVGTELSADLRHLGAGGSVSLPTTGADTLGLHLSAASWRARSPNAVDPVEDGRALAWDESHLDAGVRYRAVRGALTLTGGVDASRTVAGQPARRSARTSGEVYASGTRPLGRAWRFEGGVVVGGEPEGAGGLLRLERALTPGAQVGVAVSLRSGGRGGPLSVWDHAVEDSTLLGALGVAHEGLQERRQGTRGTLRLDGSMERGGWRSEANVFVHQFRGELRPGLVHVWDGDVVVGHLGPLAGGSGDVVGGSLSVRAGSTSAVSGGARLDLIRPTGTAAFEDWWSGAPRVRGRGDVRVAVRPGWAVHGAVSARGPVRWSGFEDVEPRAEVPGGGRLPGVVDADAHLVGDLLAGRVRMIVGIANLLDRDTRRHPLGAGQARSLVVGMVAAL